MASRLPLVATLVAALLLGHVARAEPTAAEKETARSLMDEGNARRKLANLRGALESFNAADAIMHVPTTGLEVARTQASLGLLVEARDTVKRVLRIPARPNDPDPFVAARADAQALDADLDARIPSIRVVLRGAELRDSTIAIDDATLPAAAIAGEAFKVDPGAHVVRAMTASAKAEARVDVAERETKEVTLDVVAASSRASSPAQEHEDVPRAPGEPLEAPSHASPLRVLGWSGVVLGGAGIVVGSIAGVVSLSQTSAVRAQCQGNRCPESTQGDIDAARTTATISTVAFVAAGVGVAAALTGFLAGSRAEVKHEAHVVPWIAPGGAGVAGTF
jgi:hypothetical protein